MYELNIYLSEFYGKFEVLILTETFQCEKMYHSSVEFFNTEFLKYLEAVGKTVFHIAIGDININLLATNSDVKRI